MVSPSGGEPLASLSAALWLAALPAYFVCFSYFYLVMLFLNMVCLTVGLVYYQLRLRTKRPFGGFPLYARQVTARQVAACKV
jgi:hypothetical protein